MVAVGADLVDAQAGETAMAVATNTHADRLVDTLDIVRSVGFAHRSSTPRPIVLAVHEKRGVVRCEYRC